MNEPADPIAGGSGDPAGPGAQVAGSAAEDQRRQAGDEGVIRYSQAQLARGRELLARLYALRRAARLYPLEHPSVRESASLFLEAVTTFHAEGADVHLAFLEDEALLGEQLLAEESIVFDQLIRDLWSAGIGSLVIERGVTLDELMRASGVLTADREDIQRAGGLASMVSRLGLEHVLIGSLKVVEHAPERALEGGEPTKVSYGDAVSLLRELERLMRADRGLNAGAVKGVVKGLVDNVMLNRQAMLQLASLKDFDEYTFYHSANVAVLALALGSMITDDPRFLSSLGTGALLHDIGKLAVGLDIINKPGTLTAEEWALVREHPVRGAQIVARIPGLDKGAIVIVLEHHMRIDGTGYPTSHLRRPQHLASRIVAVADAYDAMTSRRTYSAARVQDEAMSLLARSAGTSLDPVLVRLFIRMMGVYPVRSAVRLSDGRIGIVVSANETEPVRPVVRVIGTESGQRVEPYDVDLAGDPTVAIDHCIDPRLLTIDVDEFV